jgi:hypothetical protein
VDKPLPSRHDIVDPLRTAEKAEWFEWGVLVVIVAAVASLVFGPNGPVLNLVKDGVTKISTIINRPATP